MTNGCAEWNSQAALFRPLFHRWPSGSVRCPVWPRIASFLLGLTSCGYLVYPVDGSTWQGLCYLTGALLHLFVGARVAPDVWRSVLKPKGSTLMSDTARPNQNQTIVYALAAIVVLLIAIVVVMVVRDNKTVAPVAVAPAATTPATTGQTGQPAAVSPSAAPGAITLVAPAGFDAAAATKVPAGTEPKAFVEGYYKAVDAKDYAKALGLTPAVYQKTQTADGLKGQLESYGITGWTFVSEDTKGNLRQVNIDQQTGAGTFSNGWLFQKSGSSWVLVEKKVTGMK